MATSIIIHNPAFLSDVEIFESFTARQADLEWVIKRINAGASGHGRHLLVYGSRGAGKTMLIRRIAAEIRHAPKLSVDWFPIALPEEINHVGTPGEFWIEVVTQIAQETEQERWIDVVDQLLGEQVEETLCEKAFVRVIEFAKSVGKRILLVVENFNRLIDKQIKVKGALALLDSLSRNSNITLLATATTLPTEIRDTDGKLHPYFQIRELEPLNEDECGRVWESVTGMEPDVGRIKALKILTGGNTRLLVIMSRFGADKSLKSLMDELTHLVDEHTAYFKNIIDSLSLTEGKVFHALAEIWEPATAREVARIARYDTSTTSSYLTQLVDKGLVMVVRDHKRKKWYQLTERMYNIYYLMRRGGAVSSRVNALIRFMVSFYSQEDIVDLARCIADEAVKSSDRDREQHYYAFLGILKLLPTESLRARLRKATPIEFADSMGAPPVLKKWFEGGYTYQFNEKVRALVEKASDLSEDPEDWDEAESIYKEAIRLSQRKEELWFILGLFLETLRKKYREAEQSYKQMIAVNPQSALGWFSLANLLHHRLENFEGAEQAYRRTIELEPAASAAWGFLGDLLGKIGQFDEARKAYQQALELEPDAACFWVSLGRLLQDHFRNYAEAEKAYRKATELTPWLLMDIRDSLADLMVKLERPQDFNDYIRRYIQDTDIDFLDIQEAIEILINIAACGHAKDVLEILRDSGKSELFEPLIAAVELFLNEDTKAPTEMLEVARDVMDRIQKRGIEMRHKIGGDEIPPEG